MERCCVCGSRCEVFIWIMRTPNVICRDCYSKRTGTDTLVIPKVYWDSSIEMRKAKQ
jgi:NMD protein affecting ribosome stability and mRNA decay